jgi:hypothetical protein
MPKGGIADQAGELEPVAKLASQRKIHSFTHQEGRNLGRIWSGARNHSMPIGSLIACTIVESEFEYK